MSHNNPGATDAVPHAGPTKGRQLSVADVKTVPGIFTSNPTVKKESHETILIAAGITGIRKINATGKSLDQVSFLPYPGLEELAARATPETLEAALAETAAAVRAKDDAKIIALSKKLEALGFGRQYTYRGGHDFPAQGIGMFTESDSGPPLPPRGLGWPMRCLSLSESPYLV